MSATDDILDGLRQPVWIMEIPKTEQVQYSTEQQLRELVAIAHRVGLYDAADWIKKGMGWR